MKERKVLFPANNLFVFAAKESAEEKEDERCSTEWQRDNFNRTLVNSKGKQKNTRSYQLEYSWTFWITDVSSFLCSRCQHMLISFGKQNIIY